MRDLTQVYKKLTSVDIEEQKQIWDERGKGYWGEYLVFKQLYQNVEGQSKILMNLNVPTEYGTRAAYGKTTEIDLLMIHESGLYVFEIKYYKGTIYGKYSDSRWTQFFKTQSNSHFSSPVKQNEYHIAALRKIYPSLPIRSFIVFTNEDTEVKVTGWEDTGTVVCRIDELPRYVREINSQSSERITPERIDVIFGQLKGYAPIMQEPVTPDGKILPFADYLDQIKADYETAVSECRTQEKKKYKQKIGTILGVALVVCGIAIIAAALIHREANDMITSAKKSQAAAEQKMEAFAQKFERAVPYNDGDFELTEGFVECLDAELRKSSDIEDMVTFTGKIKVNGEKYGIHISNASLIIVQKKDGTVIEYTFKELPPGYHDHIIGPFSPWYWDSMDLPEIQIFTEEPDDIAHIKLANVSLCTLPNSYINIKENLEFELYSAP